MFEEPLESAHLCSSVINIITSNDYTLIRYSIRIRIVAADSVRDSILTKISNLHVASKERIPGKRCRERNVDIRCQVQLEEERNSSTRQSWMKIRILKSI